MGTLSFDGKFKGMRKSQDFIVYPLSKENEAKELRIQSNTRMGTINLLTGVITMTPPRQGGSYSVHMVFAKEIDVLSKEELVGIKFRLVQTANPNAGNNGMCIYTDNSNADKVSILN